MITVSFLTYDNLGIIVVVRISEVFRLALNVSGRKKKAGYFVFAVFQPTVIQQHRLDFVRCKAIG